MHSTLDENRRSNQAMIPRCTSTAPQKLKLTHWQPHRNGPVLSKLEGSNGGRLCGTDEQTRDTAFVRYIMFKVPKNIKKEIIHAEQNNH